MKRTVVRLFISRERETEAEREVLAYASALGLGAPRRLQSGDLAWDFTGPNRIERAQAFWTGLENTPGVHLWPMEP